MNVTQYEMLGNKPSFELLCYSFQRIYRHATLVSF